MRIFFRLCILVFPYFLVSACKLAPVYNVEDAAYKVPSNTTLSDIERAIIRGSTKVGWKARHISSRTILAKYTFKRNKYSATVRIDFDRDSYSIAYSESRNLKYTEGYPQSASDDNIISGANEFFTNANPFEKANDSATNQAGPKVHKTYNEWIRSLESSINRELSALSEGTHGVRAWQSAATAKACDDILKAIVSGQASITKSRVNIRAGAGTHCQIVGTVSKDDFFELLGKKDNWYYIALSTGKEAWVYAPLVKKSAGYENSIAAVKADNISVNPPPPAPPPVTQPGERISIAVVRFKTLNTKAQDIALGDLISETFTTALVNSKAYKIIERAQLDKVIKELEMSQTGFIDTTDAVAIGKMVNADAIITGSVALLAGQLQLNARIIEIESAYVISAETRTTSYSLRNINKATQEIVQNLSRKFVNK